MKHRVIAKTFNRFFTQPKVVKKLKNLVKKKIKRFGKFWNQVPPEKFFKNWPNFNWDDVDKWNNKRLNEARRMQKFLDDSILEYKVEKKVRVENEISMVSLKNDKLYLLIDFNNLTKYGNPNKLFKYGYWYKTGEAKSDGSEKEIFIHDPKHEHGDSDYYEDTSEINHIGTSVLAHVGTKIQCAFCQGTMRHPYTKLKKTIPEIFKQMHEYYVEKENISVEEAQEKYRYLNIDLVLQYDNLVWCCKNCGGKGASLWNKYHDYLDGREFTDKEIILDLPKQLDEFGNWMKRALAFNNYGVEDFKIDKHSYFINPKNYGLSKRINEAYNLNKFVEDKK